MKHPVRCFALFAGLALCALPAFGLSSNSAGDIVRAQILINKVLKVVDQYRQYTVVLEAPEPIQGNTGKFLLPYKADGQPTEWANKTLNVAAGKIVGDKAGDAASRAIASKVPFGGLAAGLVKKKTKEVTAVALLGGPEYIKKTSDLSFANLNDYAVYLHVRHSSDPGYKQAIAAAMAVYPELEGSFEGAIQQAYRTQGAKAGLALK